MVRAALLGMRMAEEPEYRHWLLCLRRPRHLWLA